MKKYLWIKSHRTTINGILGTIFTGLFLNTISEAQGNVFSDFGNILKQLLEINSLSGFLTVLSLAILIVFNVSYLFMYILLEKNYDYGENPVNIETTQINTDEKKAYLYSVILPGIPKIWEKNLDDTTLDLIERTGLIELMEQALTNKETNTVIIGKPGTGKSTLVQQFRRKNEEKIDACFYCKWDEGDANNSLDMIRSIVIQLLENNDIFCCELYKLLQDKDASSLLELDAEKLFELLLVFPIINLSLKDPFIIIIDALDELEDARAFVKILKNSILKTQNKVNYILTARKKRLFRGFDKRCRFIDLNKCDKDDDIEKYIKLRFRDKRVEYSLATIKEVCKGNFLYAKYFCDCIESDAEINTVFVPDDLEEIYYSYFGRIFLDIKKYNIAYREALSIILAIKGGISIYQLQDILQWDDEITASFWSKIEDLVLEDFSDRIYFYHKSWGDWLQNVNAAKEYYVTQTIGTRRILEYVYNMVQCNTLSCIPYPITRNWKNYILTDPQNITYKLLQDNWDFRLWMIGEYRRNSDFDLAVAEINYNSSFVDINSIHNYELQLVLNDIYIDLEDEKAKKQIEQLVESSMVIPNNKPYTAIHLYENAGWIYMQASQFELSEEYFKKAINIFEEEVPNVIDRVKYAHTLYLYAILLYRIKEYEDCERNLIKSQEYIESEEDKKTSLAYSLGQKLSAWIEIKKNNYNKAELLFKEALEIQNNIFKGNGTYIAHTLKCLAENEMNLYSTTSEKEYLSLASLHSMKAYDIYSTFDSRYITTIQHLKKMMGDIQQYENNK
ncbi:MAG: ATP-binding protein [Methanobrevibacter sp.]|nr:ATP-binding protein [Methanobrevibacter sp.]